MLTRIVALSAEVVVLDDDVTAHAHDVDAVARRRDESLRIVLALDADTREAKSALGAWL